MATKRTSARVKKTQEKSKYQCRHCTFSYDWHDKAYDGGFILCRCPYYTDGKWCQFLSHPACEHFNLRKGVVVDGEE